MCGWNQTNLIVHCLHRLRLWVVTWLMSGGIHWAIMCFFLSLTVKSSSLTNANIFLFSHNGPRNAECACACVRQFTIPSSIFAGHKTHLSQKWKQNKQTLKSVALFNFNKLSCFVCCAVSHLGNCLCIIGPNVYSCRLWLMVHTVYQDLCPPMSLVCYLLVRASIDDMHTRHE